MKVRELKQYLSKWPEDEDVRFLAIKPKDRIVWPNNRIGVIVITDSQAPVIGLELNKSEPMDEEMIQAAEADEAVAKWIPVTERLPEDGYYLTTLDGELVNQEEPFTGMCGIENGKWDEEGCVLAWMPLPEPYKEE